MHITVVPYKWSSLVPIPPLPLTKWSQHPVHNHFVSRSGGIGTRLDILGPIPWLTIPNNSGQSDRSPLGHVSTENHAQTSYANKGIDTCVYDTGVEFQGVGGTISLFKPEYNYTKQ